jgi:hypothetical protein
MHSVSFLQREDKEKIMAVKVLKHAFSRKQVSKTSYTEAFGKVWLLTSKINFSYWDWSHQFSIRPVEDLRKETLRTLNDDQFYQNPHFPQHSRFKYNHWISHKNIGLKIDV